MFLSLVFGGLKKIYDGNCAEELLRITQPNKLCSIGEDIFYRKPNKEKMTPKLID